MENIMTGVALFLALASLLMVGIAVVGVAVMPPIMVYLSYGLAGLMTYCLVSGLVLTALLFVMSKMNIGQTPPDATVG